MPDIDRIVVVNTTPIISLSLIGELELLKKLYQIVFIPPAVEDEILEGGRDRIGIREYKIADYIQRKDLKDPSRALLLSDLDRGEAEVIALAQEINADLVIIDEISSEYSLQSRIERYRGSWTFVKSKTNELDRRD